MWTIEEGSIPMIKISKSPFIIILLILSSGLQVAAGEKQKPFSPYVDGKGIIVLPGEFRSTWVHLGTWVLTSSLAAGPGLGPTSPQTGIHNVYAKPEAVKSYKQHGTWPEGGVLVMEVRAIKWDDLPTGHVIEEGEPLQWFVMIKEGKGRFPGNANWGDGWGWALFNPRDPKKNISTDYKKDCTGCHDAAKKSDWIFAQGYPSLR